MNRHTRRSQAAQGQKLPASEDVSKALSTIQSLQELASVVERLNLFLGEAAKLEERLAEAQSSVQAAQAENSLLREALEKQRQTFLRMFAQGMGISMEDVLSMERDIQHANTSSESVESAHREAASST
jgi:regulator of replication initiation timing